MLTYPESTTYSAPDPQLVSQWKQKLSDREVRLVETRIGTMLGDRGYELSGLPSLKISPQQALALRLHNYLLRT